MSHQLKNAAVAAARVQQIVPVHLCLVDDGHKEIGCDEQQCSLEARRRYTDDGERTFVQLDHTANHASIVMETAVPIRVSKHDIGSAIRAVLIRGVEDLAKIRLYP